MNTEINKFEKQRKKIKIDSISIYDFEGSVDDAIQLLTELKTEENSNLTLSVDVCWDSDDGYADLSVWSSRLETDEEFEKRQQLIAQQELAKYNKEQKKADDEKLLYQQLKQKYEGI